MSYVHPLLLSYRLERRASKYRPTNSAKRLHIDLSNVEECDALGMSIFLANLAKEVRKHPEFEFQISYPNEKKLESRIREMQIEDLLHRLGLNANQTLDLWSRQIAPSREKPSFVVIDDNREAILFLPKSSPEIGRSALNFARRNLKRFYLANSSDRIDYHQFHHVIDEIIKNAVDHSNDVSITALRFEPELGGTLRFVHCELGDGIFTNVKRFLKKAKDEKLRKLGERDSITECLHWAFLPGNTSKPHSGVNAGLGLSHIQAASHGGNIEVYFKDAQSMAYVSDFPNQYSHGQIRRRMYHVHPIPCFMYFGETR